MARPKASWGNRMVRVTIRFWTDSLPKDINHDLKTAHAKGTITITPNKERGIKSDRVFFNNKEELLPKIQEILTKNGIKLIETGKYHEVTLTKGA